MRSKIVKVMGVVLAMVMCLSMTAFAAESPSSGTFVVSGATSNGKAVAYSTTISSQYSAAVAELKTEAGLKAALGDSWNANMRVSSVIELKDAGENPTITFSMSGVTANSKVQVLYLTADGTWKTATVAVSNGAVTATFEGTPTVVAFVVDSTTVSGGTVSPKTSASQTAVVAMIGMFAMVAAFGLKKRSF